MQHEVQLVGTWAWKIPGGVVSFPASSPEWQRGTTRPGGNASARALGVMAEGMGSWGGPAVVGGDCGGTEALQWGLQQRYCCGIEVGMFALSVQPVLHWRKMNTAPAVMEV